jgi:hypothetical protein
MFKRNSILNVLVLGSLVLVAAPFAQQESKQDNRAMKKDAKTKAQDARNKQTGKPSPFNDPEFANYAIYARTAPQAAAASPVDTSLPLSLKKVARIALVENSLLDRAQYFGNLLKAENLSC